jgi:hypothetical protein
MSDDYKAELKRNYCVFILDKDSISNIETKGQQHVGVNSPIYLFITINDSFPYKENKKRSYLEDFPYCFLSFLFQDFLTLKGDSVKTGSYDRVNLPGQTWSYNHDLIGRSSFSPKTLSYDMKY